MFPDCHVFKLLNRVVLRKGEKDREGMVRHTLVNDYDPTNVRNRIELTGV